MSYDKPCESFVSKPRLLPFCARCGFAHKPDWIEVRGIMLRGTVAGDLVVDVQLADGRWVEGIRESASNASCISHIVEPRGLRNARPSSLDAEAQG